MAFHRENNMWLWCRAKWIRVNKGDNISAHNTHVGSLRLTLFLVPFIVKSKSFGCKERKSLAGHFDFP